MSLAIYLTDTLYFYPQGSTDQWHGNSTWHFTCLHPKFLSCRKVSMMAGVNWNTKPAVSKAPLCWFILDLLGKSWVIRKASIDVLWGAWPSVQCYSITVIFHCGWTWTQSLTTALGIWRYFSRGCFSLLHHSCVRWFGFMCDPKLFTSA